MAKYPQAKGTKTSIVKGCEGSKGLSLARIRAGNQPGNPSLPFTTLHSPSTQAEQLALWELPDAGQSDVDTEAWLDEVRRERERRYEHRVLTGAALREELRRCRAWGLQQRHQARLRRARAKQEEES